MARPKKNDARTIIYKVRLNEEENRILAEASEYASAPRSEVFRTALYDYHRTLIQVHSSSSGTVTSPDSCNGGQVVSPDSCNSGQAAQQNSANDGQMDPPDMSVPCGEGIINIRVGAIILKDNRFLMVRNGMSDYFYSVGGRIRFGETAEEAVVREVLEETGVRMEIDHLGFIQENYFIADIPSKIGKEIYEIGYYFYMKVPENFEPVCDSSTEFGEKEYLEWISADEPRTVFPDFFKTELDMNDRSVKHMVKDDRFYLRQMTLSDLEPLHALLSDPEVMKYLEPPFTLEQTENFLKAEGMKNPPRILAVEDNNHCFAGYVIYHDYDDESKEIGWVLKKEKWGKGMADLLTEQLIAIAASEGKDAVIECVPEQTAARAIAEKNGFLKVEERDGLYVYRRKRNV